MVKYKNREEFYTAVQKGGKIAEIGVLAGDNAVQILQIAKPQNLWLIDCWNQQIGSYENDPTNNTDFECVYQSVVKRFSENPEVSIVRKYSLEALNLFEDNWFDLVYIDANHNYQACLDDINAYWKKVKKGGYLAGHDYLNAGRLPWIECKQAVDDFCRVNNLIVMITCDDFFGIPSWIIKK